MILKTLRIKNQSGFERLVRYVLTDDKEHLREKGFMLTHNILSNDIEGITKEFVANDNFRIKKRKGLVLLYHEILSFSDKDQRHLTDEKLRDIAEQYIQIRCPNALALAVPHYEKNHTHIHVLVSGSEYRSKNKLLRMDNKQFEHVKHSIESYQVECYSELSNSIVYINKPKREKLNQKDRDKNVRKERAYQAKSKKKEKGGKMDKERLSIATQQMLDCSSSALEFMTFINSQEKLEVYHRGGKIAGVIYYGRKYRFTTLGISKERLRALEEEKSKVKDLPLKTGNMNLLSSVLSEKKLQEQLGMIRKEDQNKMLHQYTSKLQAIGQQTPSKQKKALKVFFVNLLNKSKTMNQLVFFTSKVGLKPCIEDSRFVGIKHEGQLYTFKDLDLKEVLREKQNEFEQFQKHMEELKNQKEKQKMARDIETDLYLGGGFFFL